MNENNEPRPQHVEAAPQAEPKPPQPSQEAAKNVPTTPTSNPTVEATLPPAPKAPVPAIIARRNQEVEREIHQMSRRSFLWAAAAVAGTYFGWKWLITRPEEDGLPWPFRRVLETDEHLARDYFQGYRLVPTFPRAMAQALRPNGDEGLSDDFDPAEWKLQVIGLEDNTQAAMMPMPPPPMPAPSPKNTLTPPNPSSADKKASDKKAPATPHRAAEKKAPVVPNDTDNSQSSDDNGSTSTDMTPQEPVVSLTLDDIKQLPRVEMVTEFKCIEGWSTVVQWAGARFADFVAKYPPAKTDGKLPEYVYMETPDGGYYVGLDMASALHPQTLLCYEMNGEPLTLEHGAPLRLVIPVKYGVKNIKRIGTIRFTDERPKDYWAMLGYDWYAGH